MRNIGDRELKRVKGRTAAGQISREELLRDIQAEAVRLGVEELVDYSAKG